MDWVKVKFDSGYNHYSYFHDTEKLGIPVKDDICLVNVNGRIKLVTVVAFIQNSTPPKIVSKHILALLDKQYFLDLDKELMRGSW